MRNDYDVDKFDFDNMSLGQIRNLLIFIKD